MGNLYEPIFNFYKKFGVIMKIVMFPVLLLCFVLWIIGNFVHINTLFMFVIGLVVGIVLMYFYGGAIYGFVDTLINAIREFINSFSILLI